MFINMEHEEILIKIKLILESHYSSIGRKEDMDYTFRQTELIEKIDDLVSKAKLDRRKLILTKFEEENK